MPNDNAIKLGILKCRDLVEIYYGARMVVQVKQAFPDVSSGQPTQILEVNPARIRYEIVLENTDGAAIGTVDLGEQKDFGSGATNEYALPINSTIIVVRSFLDDFEAVTLGVFAQASGAGVGISVRETFLTPIPVDEMP